MAVNIKLNSVEINKRGKAIITETFKNLNSPGSELQVDARRGSIDQHTTVIIREGINGSVVKMLQQNNKELNAAVKIKLVPVENNDPRAGTWDGPTNDPGEGGNFYVNPSDYESGASIEIKLLGQIRDQNITAEKTQAPEDLVWEAAVSGTGTIIAQLFFEVNEDLG